MSATVGQKMHMLCNGPFNKRHKLNVVTKRLWMMAVSPKMW
jgi:hypothetical protein